MRASEDIASFFAAHEAAIVALTLAAQEEVGGHYAVLDAAARREAAVSNVGEFTAAVVSGEIDHAGITEMVATHPDQAVVAEIVRMIVLQEQHFAAFVARELAHDPALAGLIQRRAQSLATRFRMSLASASLTELIQRTELPAPPDPVQGS